MYSYSWFREVDGQLQPIFSSSRFEPLQDVLLIRNLKTEDTGRWTCKANNQFGEQLLDIHLVVSAHLSLHVVPQLQVISLIIMATCIKRIWRLTERQRRCHI